MKVSKKTSSPRTKKSSSKKTSSPRTKTSSSNKRSSPVKNNSFKKLNEIQEYIKNNKKKVAVGAIGTAMALHTANQFSKLPSIQIQLSKVKSYFVKNIPITKAILGELFSESYEIGEVLGEGSYGQVFIAKDKKTGQQVVIKKMVIKPYDDPHSSFGNGKRGFQMAGFTDLTVRNEINVLKKLARLNSKYTTKYITHKYYEDSIYLVLSYDYSDNLKDIINMDVSKEIKEEIFNNCITGLKKLHYNNITHNDIKPENIIVDKDTGSIKYIDFGLACDYRCFHRKGEGSVLTLAPEMIEYVTRDRIKQPLPFLTFKESKNTDVWSLGVTLYKSLYKKHPYVTDSMMGSPLLKTIQDMINNMNNILYDDTVVDKKYNDILKSMLVIDPSKRIKSSDITTPKGSGTKARTKWFFGLF